jgi:hypothetical protein
MQAPLSKVISPFLWRYRMGTLLMRQASRQL